HENYSDRNASSMVGTYHSTVSEQYTPYIMPQENGHKGDVRWLNHYGFKPLDMPTLAGGLST
ncbi:MAG: hypothetical protein NT113_16620, partial [Hyphomicrobiales bacterium]|nr:hypothetical protein [Hyphomicrobiales bacterium]